MKNIERRSHLSRAVISAWLLVTAVGIGTSPSLAEYDTGKTYGPNANVPGHVGQYSYNDRLDAPGHWVLRHRFDQFEQDGYDLGYGQPQWQERAYREHFERGFDQGRADARSDALAGRVYADPSPRARTFRDQGPGPRSNFRRPNDEWLARDLYPQDSSTFDPEALTGRLYRDGEHGRSAQSLANVPLDQPDSQFESSDFARFGFGSTRWSTPFGSEDRASRRYRR